tara:strand:+ start:732 stop:1181 length:450 start_codon:yes stop_codon:yes gene_type:complete
MSNLKQELEETNYNDLKKKFTELGIESAYTAGKKKVDLINIAIDVLDKLKVDSIPVVASEIVTADVDPVLEAIKEVEEDKAIEAESEKSDFDKAVEAIVSKKEFYTKESIDKKIFQLHNVFLQNRGTVKGTECQEREEILKAASLIMFK